MHFKKFCDMFLCLEVILHNFDVLISDLNSDFFYHVTFSYKLQFEFYVFTMGNIAAVSSTEIKNNQIYRRV